MIKPKTQQRLTAEKICRQFPKHGDLTLSKKLFKDFPLLYTSVENARCHVRTVRGHKGKKIRDSNSDKSLHKPVTYKTTYDLPESFSDSFEPYKITSSRTLIISDLHIPYHDNEAISLALDYGKEKNVNCILINGDLIDFHNQSRFEKDPHARSTSQEFEATRKFLDTLRKHFPKALIIYKLGNHCERFERWLYIKAPEIFDDPEFLLEVRLKLGERGIDIVKDGRPIEIGKLTVLHGHELNGSGGVNPARATFLKTIANVLIGHVHRSSQHVESTYGGDTIMTTSTGCLCGMTPKYARVNKWNQGFAYVELNVKTGEFNLTNLKIHNGRIYV